MLLNKEELTDIFTWLKEGFPESHGANCTSEELARLYLQHTNPEPKLEPDYLAWLLRSLTRPGFWGPPWYTDSSCTCDYKTTRATLSEDMQRVYFNTPEAYTALEALSCKPESCIHPPVLCKRCPDAASCYVEFDTQRTDCTPRNLYKAITKPLAQKPFSRVILKDIHKKVKLYQAFLQDPDMANPPQMQYDLWGGCIKFNGYYLIEVRGPLGIEVAHRWTSLYPSLLHSQLQYFASGIPERLTFEIIFDMELKTYA